MNETMRKMADNTLSTLYLAFELSNKKWRLGFTIGLGQRPRERTIAAGDLVALEKEIRLAKKRFGLPETARVMSCYEAGRDGPWSFGPGTKGFWLHRYLVSKGVENLVVDSASIEVSRRAKRAKTDRLDPSASLRAGSGEADDDADSLRLWREEGVERGARAQSRSGRQAASAPAIGHTEDRPDAAHQPHQGTAGRTRGAHGCGGRFPGKDGKGSLVGRDGLAHRAAHSAGTGVRWLGVCEPAGQESGSREDGSDPHLGRPECGQGAETAAAAGHRRQ